MVSFSKPEYIDLNRYYYHQHYDLDKIHQMIDDGGFDILEEKLIGSSVYEPLANYYVEHRKDLKKLISEKYPNYVEKILFKSLEKMKRASEKKIVDYALIKCRLK